MRGIVSLTQADRRAPVLALENAMHEANFALGILHGPFVENVLVSSLGAELRARLASCSNAATRFDR